ncbi:MAG: hypothetical protein WD066_10165 [Planctomycetaceae bacterium]
MSSVANFSISRATANLALVLATSIHSAAPAHSGLFGHCKHRRACCDSAPCDACHGSSFGHGGGWIGMAGGAGYAPHSFGGLDAASAPWGHPPRAGVPPRRPLPEVLPPPGTLGTTYTRTSRPIPEDKHPRMAMLEVRGVAGREVTVAGMKGYKADDGVWHFETEKPLVPGAAPFIHEVRARDPADTSGAGDLRVVRLIPARIVTLDY